MCWCALNILVVASQASSHLAHSGALNPSRLSRVGRTTYAAAFSSDTHAPVHRVEQRWRASQCRGTRAGHVITQVSLIHRSASLNFLLLIHDELQEFLRFNSPHDDWSLAKTRSRAVTSAWLVTTSEAAPLWSFGRVLRGQTRVVLRRARNAADLRESIASQRCFHVR